MKSVFSRLWNKSRQPRKQRKYAHNAPAHIKHKFLSAPLSRELRKKHGIRNIPVRKGDIVKVTTGNFKGKEGKIEKVLPKKTRVLISGIQVTKSDGKKAYYPIHPSNLLIKELELADKKRKAIIERKTKQKTSQGGNQ